MHMNNVSRLVINNRTDSLVGKGGLGRKSDKPVASLRTKYKLIYRTKTVHIPSDNRTSVHNLLHALGRCTGRRLRWTGYTFICSETITRRCIRAGRMFCSGCR